MRMTVLVRSYFLHFFINQVSFFFQLYLSQRRKNSSTEHYYFHINVMKIVISELSELFDKRAIIRNCCNVIYIFLSLGNLLTWPTVSASRQRADMFPGQGQPLGHVVTLRYSSDLAVELVRLGTFGTIGF